MMKSAQCDDNPMGTKLRINIDEIFEFDPVSVIHESSFVITAAQRLTSTSSITQLSSFPNCPSESVDETLTRKTVECLQSECDECFGCIGGIIVGTGGLVKFYVSFSFFNWHIF